MSIKGLKKNCPKCKVTLTESVMQNGVELDSCEMCQGVWLDKGELEQMVKTHPKISHMYFNVEEIVNQKQSTEFACPNCHSVLLTGAFSHFPETIVEVCETCEGIWCDRHELTELVQWPKA